MTEQEIKDNYEELEAILVKRFPPDEHGEDDDLSAVCTIAQELRDESIKLKNSCLLKAGTDEPIFVLRAQDISSPKVILHWIAKNFESTPEEKLRDAFERAIEMKNWPTRKNPD